MKPGRAEGAARLARPRCSTASTCSPRPGTSPHLEARPSRRPDLSSSGGTGIYAVGGRGTVRSMPRKSRPRLFEVRPSSLHGMGGFALVAIPQGTRIAEYTGERMTEAEVDERYAE